MQIFASLFRSCLLLALSTGSLGQSVPASALDEIRGELHELRAELADENAALRHELEEKNTDLRLALKNELRVELAEVQEKNTAIENKNALKFEEVTNELEEVKNENTALRALLQTQPRRTVETKFLDCINTNSDAENIYFDGCNVHVRSGGGSTDAPPNGKGNIIIGYNKPRDSLMEVPESAEGLEETEAKKVEAVELDVSDSRGGSHNLIIGDEHEYTSYGGIVTGQQNRITHIYSAVVGGSYNEATGYFSTVIGGTDNEASGAFSSISGGYYNTASGRSSSISGGVDNTASGQWSSISGGDGNTASGVESSISGGNGNTASGDDSSVLGGRSNVAQGRVSVVTGGLNNKAIGEFASVVGGKRNKAKGKFSVVTGA